MRWAQREPLARVEVIERILPVANETVSKVQVANDKVVALEKELAELIESVPTLEQAMESARTGSLPELIAAATALKAAVGDGTDKDKGRIGYLRDVGIPNAKQAVASAEFDEKFESVKSGYEPLRQLVKDFIDADKMAAAKESGIKSIVLTIDLDVEGTSPTVSLAPRATKTVSATTKTSTNGSGGGKSSNVYTHEGVSYTSRELVEKFGDASKPGVANALATGTGLTHVADGIIKKLGGSKTS